MVDAVKRGCAYGVDPTGAETSESTVGSFSDDASLLPEPSYFALGGGDPGAELAKLVLESAREDKIAGRRTRASEERAERAAEDMQLKKMAEKADAAFASGMLSGLSGVASGAAGLAGAGAVKATHDTADGVGKMIEGEGKLGAAFFEHDAKMADKEVEHAHQLAGRHKRAVDDVRDEVKEAKGLIDRAIGFYKEYAAAKSDAQKAALMRA